MVLENCGRCTDGSEVYGDWLGQVRANGTRRWDKKVINLINDASLQRVYQHQHLLPSHSSISNIAPTLAEPRTHPHHLWHIPSFHLLSRGLNSHYWALVCLQINASHRVLDQCDYISYKAGWCRGSGGQQEGKHRGGVRVKGRGSSRRSACLRLRGDVMTAWQFDVKQGLGKDEWMVGLNNNKKNAYRWDEGRRAYWSAVYLLLWGSLANRGPSVYHLQRQCGDGDAPSGDMEMCIKLCNSACLHDADKMAVRGRS